MLSVARFRGRIKSSILRSQPLARLATVSVDLQPDAVPVGFEFDGQYFYVGGHNVAVTRKYQNVRMAIAKWHWLWMIYSE